MISRFKGHYLIHDRETPDDVQSLASILSEKTGDGYGAFKQPHPPYEFKDASTFDSYQWFRHSLLPIIMSDSVLFGVGLGGLLAAKLQEDFPAYNLSVVAINAPTSDGLISLDSRVKGRVALFSGLYPAITSTCNWSRYASQSYDVPWLQHGIKNRKFALAHLMMKYMQHENLVSEVKLISGDEVKAVSIT